MRNFSVTKSIIQFVLFIFVLAILIPLLNILAMSLSDPAKVSELSGLGILPKGFSLINYEIIQSRKYLEY